MSPKTNTSAKKQLLNYVKRAYNNLMQEKPDKNSRTNSAKRKKSTSSKYKDKTSSYEEENDKSGLLSSELLLASDSLEADKLLYKQSKKNPAILSYLMQKLSQTIRKEKISGSSGIKEDVLHFASDLYKQGQLSSSQLYNNREEYGGYGRNQLSNYTQPKFGVQEFCTPKPYFNKEGLTDSGSYGKGLNNETDKPQRCRKKSIFNYFWKILFIMNIAVMLFAVCVANNKIKDPFIEESHKVQNQNQDGLSFNNGEKTENIDLVFQKLNQDFQMMIENSASPQPKFSLKSIFSVYNVAWAIVVQIFIWIVYSMNSSNR